MSDGVYILFHFKNGHLFSPTSFSVTSQSEVPLSVKVLTPVSGDKEYCFRVLILCKRSIGTRVLKVPTAFIFDRKSATLHSFAFQKTVILYFSTFLNSTEI